MQYDGFNWDAGNEDKCRKHGLTKTNIECFFQQEKVYTAPDIKHSITESRFLAIGEGAQNRLMIVAFTFRQIRGQTLIRPISARYMNKKEVTNYEKTFKSN